MAEQDIVRFEGNERVDLPDASAFVASAADQVRALVRTLIAAENRVVSGFVASAPSATIVRITRGSGALIGRDLGAALQGELGLGGSSTVDVDFSLLPSGVLYTVYVRILRLDSGLANRAFWDRPTKQELQRPINTRRVVDWEATAAPTADPAPGLEWMPVALVNWDGSLSGADVVDAREVVFEGPLDQVQSEAGLPAYDSADLTNRTVNHLRSVDELRAAVLRDIQDLKSGHWNHDAAADGHAWFTSLPAGLSVRSAQDVVATVGDGLTTFGNFDANDPAYAGDAAAAIQAALDLTATTGGTVVIKPGTYTCRTRIDFPAGLAKSVALVGHGRSSTQLSWDSGTSPTSMLRVRPSTAGQGVTIEGLSLVCGTVVLADVDLIQVDLGALTGGNDLGALTLRDLEIRASGSGASHHVGLAFRNSTSGHGVLELTIDHCRFDALRSGVVGSRIIDRGLIGRSLFSNMAVSFIDLQDCARTTVRDSVLEGAAVADNTHLAIRTGCTDIVLEGLVGTSAQLLIETGAVGVSVDGCEVTSSSAGVTGPLVVDGSRVQVRGSRFAVPADNVLGAAGIRVARSATVKDVLIEGCLVLSSTGFGILHTNSNDSTRLAIRDCVLVENGYGTGSTTTSYGIFVGKCNHLEVSGNLIARVGTTGIELSDLDDVVMSGNVVVDDDLEGGLDEGDRIVLIGTSVLPTVGRAVVADNLAVGLKEIGHRCASPGATFTGNLAVRIRGGSAQAGIRLAGEGIAASACSVVDCAGVGFELSADGIGLSGAGASSVDLDGFFLNTADACRLVNCRANVCGDAGFNGAGGKGGTPNVLSACVATGCGLGFTVGGWAVLEAPVVAGAAGVAIELLEDARASLSDITIVDAKGAAGLQIDAGVVFSVHGGQVLVDTSSPASYGVWVFGAGTVGDLSGLYIRGHTDMSVRPLSLEGPARVTARGCVIEDWGDGNKIAVLVSTECELVDCRVLGTGGGEAIRLTSGGVARGCQVHRNAPGIAADGTTHPALIEGCRFWDAAANTDYITVSNTAGATIMNCLAETNGDIELGAINNNIVLGNRGFDVNGSGTNKPTTMTDYNIATA